MRFIYKAKKGPGEIIQGEVEADNEDAALGKITAAGLVPVKLTPIGLEIPSPASGKREGIAETAPVNFNRQQVRITHRDLNVFTRQFAILSKASVPLLKIFDVLSNQTQNLKFRSVLKEIQKKLQDGGGLSETLAIYPKIFSQIYVSLIHSGEISGTLDQVLAKLAEFAEKEAETRAKVQSAMIYPAFLFLVGIGTVFILMTFVMPRLMGLFSDLGTPLPGITIFMMSISRFLQRTWIFIGAAIAAVVFWLRTKGLSDSQQRQLDHFLAHAPAIGKVVEKSEVARFLRSIELLYENGIPLYKAVSIGAKTVTNVLIREQLEKIPDLLEGGATLAKSLEQAPFVSPFVCQMVAVGEESGALTSALRETALFYEQETDQFVKLATSLLEPFMILSIGIVVGFIVISMLLPIFEIHVAAQ